MTSYISFQQGITGHFCYMLVSRKFGHIFQSESKLCFEEAHDCLSLGSALGFLRGNDICPSVAGTVSTKKAGMGDGGRKVLKLKDIPMERWSHQLQVHE